MFKNLLGKDEYKIINLLELNENILLSGINSIGISTVTRAILEVLNEKNILTLHLFSFEIEELNEREIEAYFINKLKSTFGIDLKTLDDLFTKTNYKLVVAVDKIDSFKNKDILIKFLQEVRSKSFYKLSLLLSCSLQYYYSNTINYGGFHKFLFKGFTEKYNELIYSFCEYYDIKKLSDQEIKIVSDYSGRHTGLTKSILINYKSNNELSSVDNIFKDNEDINNRCRLIVTDLAIAKISEEEILNDKKIVKLEDLGVAFMGKLATIIQYYCNSKLSTNNTELTKTEQKIFDFLNYTTYKTIDEILDLVAKEDFEITNWTVYKHINNINKKQKNNGIKILNDRKKGYKLAQI